MGYYDTRQTARKLKTTQQSLYNQVHLAKKAGADKLPIGLTLVPVEGRKRVWNQSEVDALAKLGRTANSNVKKTSAKAKPKKKGKRTYSRRQPVVVERSPALDHTSVFKDWIIVALALALLASLANGWSF